MTYDDSHFGILRHRKTIEILLEAGEIPLGSTVRKVTGTRKFTLSDKLVLYDVDGTKKEISVDKTSRILISSGGAVHNAIGCDKKLIWEAEPWVVSECLEAVPQ